LSDQKVIEQAHIEPRGLASDVTRRGPGNGETVSSDIGEFSAVAPLAERSVRHAAPRDVRSPPGADGLRVGRDREEGHARRGEGPHGVPDRPPEAPRSRLRREGRAREGDGRQTLRQPLAGDAVPKTYYTGTSRRNLP
jgi:hypothetical protein